jgi:hypothetical protein
MCNYEGVDTFNVLEAPEKRKIIFLEGEYNTTGLQKLLLASLA